MNDCQCVCHTGWPTPEHPYGECCWQIGAVYPRSYLLTVYDEDDLPPQATPNPEEL